MTLAELERLESLTKDYATFQARKSGLATALGGLMVLLLFWVAVLPHIFHVRLLQRPALECFLFAPLGWLVLKAVLGRAFYRGLGVVKAEPDHAYERRRWIWILGLGLFLLAFLTLAVYGFVSGAFIAAKPAVTGLPADAPLFHPWPRMIWMPFLYLAAAPWAIRGIEEARAYAALVGQCMLWQIPVFLFAFGDFRHVYPVSRLTEVLLVLALVGLVVGIAVWAPLAMIRGWREHRAYLRILGMLPKGEDVVR